MSHSLGAAQPVNHAHDAAIPAQQGDVHAALAQIADIIVESGDGLTLESLIKAFWRTYSTPQGNIVSIHEGRNGAPTPVVAEDAFARLAGRMDQIAESLGFVSGRLDEVEVRDTDPIGSKAAAVAYADPRAIEPDAPAAIGDDRPADPPTRRRHNDDNGDEGNAAPAIETSLPDRAQFEVALAENYRIARNEVEPLSVAICSVSRIEQIVEHHGLHTATRLMERVAATLSMATKGECYTARKSSSEFIMLARGITISQFQEILEQSIIDLSVRRWHDKFSNKTLGMVEMHIGAAHVFDFVDPSSAMRAADLAHERAMLEHTSTVILAGPDELSVDQDTAA